MSLIDTLMFMLTFYIAFAKFLTYNLTLPCVKPGVLALRNTYTGMT